MFSNSSEQRCTGLKYFLWKYGLLTTMTPGSLWDTSDLNFSLHTRLGQFKIEPEALWDVVIELRCRLVY